MPVLASFCCSYIHDTVWMDIIFVVCTNERNAIFLLFRRARRIQTNEIGMCLVDIQAESKENEIKIACTAVCRSLCMRSIFEKERVREYRIVNKSATAQREKHRNLTKTDKERDWIFGIKWKIIHQKRVLRLYCVCRMSIVQAIVYGDPKNQLLRKCLQIHVNVINSWYRRLNGLWHKRDYQSEN